MKNSNTLSAVETNVLVRASNLLWQLGRCQPGEVLLATSRNYEILTVVKGGAALAATGVRVQVADKFFERRGGGSQHQLVLSTLKLLREDRAVRRANKRTEKAKRVASYWKKLYERTEEATASRRMFADILAMVTPCFDANQVTPLQKEVNA